MTWTKLLIAAIVLGLTCAEVAREAYRFGYKQAMVDNLARNARQFEQMARTVCK